MNRGFQRTPPFDNPAVKGNFKRWETLVKEFEPNDIRIVFSDKRQDNKIFDINGRQLKQPSKGINVIDGKKVVVK